MTKTATPDLFGIPQGITAKALLTAARGMMEAGCTKKEAISSWDAAMAYLHLVHGNPRNEQLRVLFLDRKNALICDKVMGVGSVDHCPVYIREILREAILCDASAIIVAHNHPSGDPSPSQADISMTKELAKACNVIGITLHDSIIIGNGRDHSMRGAGNF
jgi:DNA repair protein RadC